MFYLIFVGNFNFKGIMRIYLKSFVVCVLYEVYIFNFDMKVYSVKYVIWGFVRIIIGFCFINLILNLIEYEKVRMRLFKLWERVFLLIFMVY